MNFDSSKGQGINLLCVHVYICISIHANKCNEEKQAREEREGGRSERSAASVRTVVRTGVPDKALNWRRTAHSTLWEEHSRQREQGQEHI
jgi:hypothetical protein